METKLGGGELLEYGGELIRKGELVAFPTETVYGIGADAFDPQAVAKIFIAKGRPQDNPLIVHIANIKDIKNVARGIPLVAYDLMREFSPGPLTLVLKKKKDLPDITTAGLDTVGIRIPAHPMALALIESSGRAIAAPSANSSGRVSPTTALHVFEDMKGKIPLILDGGSTEIGIESTVLDLTKDIPIILRPGAVNEKMLSGLLHKVINHKGEVIVAESPGMKYRHYAPVCPSVGAREIEKAIVFYDEVKGQGKNPVIIGGDDFLMEVGNRNALPLGASSKSQMSALFSALREGEKKYDFIILQYFPDDIPEYVAINNRIIKAVGGKVL